MKLSDAFVDAGFWFRVGDYQFRLTCGCGAELTLDKCPVSELEVATVYTCPSCGDTIAGIAPDSTSAAVFPGPSRPADTEGHRMCGHAFGAKVDMELWPAAAVEPFMGIPRRPGFLTSRGLDKPADQAS